MTKTLLNIYADIPIPYPSKPFNFGGHKDYHSILEQIDYLFEDLIRIYSSDTQETLRQMYHDKTHTQFKNFGALKVLGCIRVNKDTYNKIDTTKLQSSDFSLEVHEDLIDSPLFLKVFKIHEVAFHIGQICHLVEQHSLRQYAAEFQNGYVSMFLEASVAPMEKFLFTAIPDQHFLHDSQKGGNGAQSYFQLITKTAQTPADEQILDHIRIASHRINLNLLFTFLQRDDFNKLKTLAIKSHTDYLTRQLIRDTAPIAF